VSATKLVIIIIIVVVVVIVVELYVLTRVTLSRKRYWLITYRALVIRDVNITTDKCQGTENKQQR